MANNARITDVNTIIAAGINPKTGLPFKMGGTDNPKKQDIKAALRIMDEQDAINRYTWYNVPKGLDGQLMERILYYRGQGAFFYMPTDETFYFLPYALSGTIDVYGRYTDITPVPFGGGKHGLTCFYSVGRVDDRHTGNGAHQRDILVTLMGSTVLAYGNTGVSSTDLYVGVRIADGVADLLVGAASRKHSEGRCKRDLAGQREADSHVDHIVLSDTAIEETIGECLLENAGLGSAGQVGIQNHQVIELGTQLLQSVAVAVTGCNLLNICHNYASSSAS